MVRYWQGIRDGGAAPLSLGLCPQREPALGSELKKKTISQRKHLYSVRAAYPLTGYKLGAMTYQAKQAFPSQAGKAPWKGTDGQRGGRERWAAARWPLSVLGTAVHAPAQRAAAVTGEGRLLAAAPATQ